MNFVPAVAHHFCLALSAGFTQPGDRLLADFCIHYVLPSYNFSDGAGPQEAAAAGSDAGH